MTTTATASSTQTTWKIDPAHSLVEFAVRHLMITTVKGRFGGVQGTVKLDSADPAYAEVDVRIDVPTIDTREPQRDAHLRSADFFDVERFSSITFKATAPIARRGDDFQLVGDLTIHRV